jgi:molybdopterin/thiamine biosynthesis adenylyltransferase
VQRRFSNKPVKTGAYADFYDKIESYLAQVSAPAMSKYDASPYTCRTRPDDVIPTVFKFADTLTSRAEILDLAAKFNEDTVAIIGLGGTGAYVLDFLVKTPVKEIRAFDNDDFHVHNAYRSPGRLTETELRRKKAEVYADRYVNFREGLQISTKFIDATSAADFEGVTFAFVCVDKGSSRSGISDLLLAKGIPFIDVGMGLKRKDNGLRGMVRVTYYSKEDGAKVRVMQYAEMSDGPENLYRTNVQIGELNALNAALAVLRFKQIRGFYAEEANLDHILFDISDFKTVAKPDEDDEN